MSLQRFQIWGDNDGCRAVDPDGDWVLYSEVASLLETRDAQRHALAQLVETIDAIRGDLGAQFPALSEAYVLARVALAETWSLPSPAPKDKETP